MEAGAWKPGRVHTSIPQSVIRNKVIWEGQCFNLRFFSVFSFIHFVYMNITKQKRSTEGCSKFKSPETRQVQERLVSTLEHMQVPKWDRTRCPEE